MSLEPIEVFHFGANSTFHELDKGLIVGDLFGIISVSCDLVLEELDLVDSLAKSLSWRYI